MLDIDLEFDRALDEVPALDIGSHSLLNGSATLEIDLLRTLVAIAATGSFNRAAKAVFRTPSAVSMQMKRLEDLIERPLFAREGRGVTLTADGQDLLGYARRILTLTDEAMSKFRCATTEGMVRLGTPDDYATGFLPPILARFAKTHPMVQVDVTCMSSRTLLKMLDQGEVDIALVSVGDSMPTGQIVHRERLVWAGMRDGIAWKRRPLPLAVSNPTCSWRHRALEVLDMAGLSYRVAYSSQHYVGQVAAVLADLAIAPLPASVLGSDLVRLDDTDLPQLGFYEITMMRAPTATGPAIDALAHHIRQNFALADAAAAA